MSPSPSPTAYPAVTGASSPVVTQYFIGDLGITDTFQCNDGTDNKDGYLNEMCLDGTGKFVDGQTVDCSGNSGICAFKACSEMTEDLCSVLTDLYNKTGTTLVDTCVSGGAGGTCQKYEAADIARPKDDADRSATEINKWYVGDSTYVTGYSYKCDAGADNVGPDTPYMNGLCLNSKGDAIDETKTIYCQDPQSDGLGTDPVSVTADCTLTECGKVNSDWCADGFDLYKLDGESVVYSDTCVKDTDDDTNAFCVSKSSAMSTTVGIVAGFIVMAGLL